MLVPCAQLQLDPATGEHTVLITDTTDNWINLNELFTPLPADYAPAAPAGDDAAGTPGSYFLWGSERSGFQALYLYFAPASGGPARQLHQLTRGEFNVEAVNHVDTGGNKVRPECGASSVLAFLV